MSLLFNNKLLEPTDEMLREALGERKKLLEAVSNFIEHEYGDFHSEWKFYGTKMGWTLKLYHKKRNVVFVRIESAYFLLTFAIGTRAYNEIINSTCPDAVKQQLAQATVYAEGRPLRLTIHSKEDLDPVWDIIRIKLKF